MCPVGTPPTPHLTWECCSIPCKKHYNVPGWHSSDPSSEMRMLLNYSSISYRRNFILPQMSFWENVIPIMKQHYLWGSYYAAKWSTAGKSYYLNWVSEKMFFQLWSKMIYGAPIMQQNDLWPESHTTSNKFLKKCVSNYEATWSMGWFGGRWPTVPVVPVARVCWGQPRPTRTQNEMGA